MLGKPTHLRIGPRNLTACGLVGSPHMERAAYDPRDVDCLRCKRTHTYRVKMGYEKNT